jgi:hypothetical protein
MHKSQGLLLLLTMEIYNIIMYTITTLLYRVSQKKRKTIEITYCQNLNALALSRTQSAKDA